mmetsp:Transcript_4357/g.7418  ORF Transcript_4357/g.7418 Transcript_4357/m.7418 type:complete len:233 (+) Transcript_4357:1046-1744(+)
MVGFAAHRSATSALEEVEGPAQQQHANGVHQAEKTGAKGVAQLVHGRGVRGARGHVCLPLVDVIGAHVVHGVRALPAEVRHQQECVQHIAHSVLEHLVVGKRTMPTLVGCYPGTGRARACSDGVRNPRADIAQLHRDERVRQSAAPECQRNGDQRVRQRLDGVLLEAVLGDHAHYVFLLGPIGAERTLHRLALKTAKLGQSKQLGWAIRHGWGCHGRHLERSKGHAVHGAAS